MLDQWGATFEDMRRRQTLTTDDVQTAVWDHYNAALAADDARRSALPTPAAIEAALDAATIGRQPHPAGPSVLDAINSMTEVEILVGRAAWDARRKVARVSRLRSDLTTGDTRLIEPEADDFLRKHGFKIEKGDPRYRDLCIKLMRAEIDFLRRYAEREDGDFTGKPADSIIAAPAVRTDAAMGTMPTGTIMGLFGKYERDHPNDIRLESLKQARRDVQHFADFVGSRTRPLKDHQGPRARVEGFARRLSGEGDRDEYVQRHVTRRDHYRQTRRSTRPILPSLGRLCGATWAV